MKPHSWVALALALCCLAGPSAARPVQAGGGPGGAAPPPLARWEQLAATGRSSRLFAPSDGGLVLQTEAGSVRSVDGGRTWQPLALPVDADGRALHFRGVAVHPTDGNVLYVIADESRSRDAAAALYRTGDGGATWNQVLRSSVAIAGWGEVPLSVISVEVSPADGNVVYAFLNHFGAQYGALVHSTDSGATWTQPPPRVQSGGSGGSPCGGAYANLHPHSRDPGRLLSLVNLCPAGRQNLAGFALAADAEYGASGRPSWFPARPGLFPGAVTGGFDPAPARFYVTAYVPAGGRGALFRTDDDGTPWRELLAFPSEPANRQPYLFAVAAVPSDPDRVYVGADFSGRGGVPRRGAVRASSDGGATWRDVGGPSTDIGEVSRLALAPGASWLYAGTATGLWRIAI